VNVGGSALTFGGGSVTTVNRATGADRSNDGFINLGAADGLLSGGLMINNGVVGSVTNKLVVSFGGVAKGIGLYVSVVTQNGGVFSPGLSPGTAWASDFRINGGGTFQFEIANAAGTEGAPSGWDRLILTQSILKAAPKSILTATPAD